MPPTSPIASGAGNLPEPFLSLLLLCFPATPELRPFTHHVKLHVTVVVVPL